MAAVVRQMPQSEVRSLTANKKIGQDRCSGFARVIPPKSLACSISRMEIQVQAEKAAQIFIQCFAVAPSCGQFRVSDGTYGEFVHRAAPVQRVRTNLMFRMIGVEPGDDDGGVHQDHGRVFLSSSTPEIFPFQAPARARMCCCIAFGTPVLGRANTPSSRISQLSTVPVVIPARLRKSSGMVVVPLLVTLVSAFISYESYHSEYY